jgi:hypothetical protein
MSPEYINESMWMSLNTPVRGRKILNVGSREEEMERGGGGTDGECRIVGIVGYFQGAYISRIAIKSIFAETNFVDCSLQSHTHPGLAVLTMKTTRICRLLF